MAKYILGVVNVKYADPAVDGGIASAFTKSVKPYNESVDFNDEEGELVKHFLQGDQYPFLTVYSAAGTTFKFSVPMTNENLVEWMGGEIVTGQYKAPRATVSTIKSLLLETEFEVPISIAAATCYGVRKFAKKKTDVSLIEITAVIELPSKEDEPPMTIGTKTAG